MPDFVQLVFYVAATFAPAVTPGPGIEGSGGAMITLGVGPALAKRPAT